MNSTFEERLIINSNTEGNIIHNEHLVRYQFASELVKGKTVLDIACGSGYGSKMLASAGAIKVIAMDISPEAIESAKKYFGHSNVEFRAGDATGIDLGEKTVDAVISFETIEHLSEVEKYLGELKRVVKDEGLVLISTPNKAVSGAANPFHHREFTGEEFENVLKKFFPHCLIIPQYNAIASFLKINDSEDGKIGMTNKAEPAYFLAVCSKTVETRDLASIQSAHSRASLNPVALNNLYNNPGLRLADKVYSMLVKVPGMTKLFATFKK